MSKAVSELEHIGASPAREGSEGPTAQGSNFCLSKAQCLGQSNGDIQRRSKSLDAICMRPTVFPLEIEHLDSGSCSGSCCFKKKESSLFLFKTTTTRTTTESEGLVHYTIN